MAEAKPQKHQSYADAPELGSSVASEPSDSSTAAPANGGDVDKVLFKNLVEMVPLVESLMDRRAKSSFRRRASMVYTPTPSQLRKVVDPNGRKATHDVSAKKRRGHGDNANIENASDDSSIFPWGAGGNIQKDKEELTMLLEQVDSLQKELSEKDEALKSAENELNQMKAANISLRELTRQIAEKDLLIKSANSQLCNAKIKLADKQADFERLEWEARMSNRKVEELQEHVVSMEFEVSALMQFFEELSKNDSTAFLDVDFDSFCHQEHISYIDDINEIEMEKMEEARMAYTAAVAAAKENPSEESLAAAAEARMRLQAFVL